MIAALLVIALAAYSAWAVRHIYLKRKRCKAKCGDCPYKDSGACR